MKIGYVMNSYPRVSTTFIGREIQGLEALGIEVPRIAMRRWDGALVDANDKAEAARTDYLLEDGALQLVLGFLAEAVQNPSGVRAAIRLWRKVHAAAGEGLVRHVAYLLEAVALRRRLRRDPVAHLHAHFATNAATVAMLTHEMGGPSYSFTVHGPDELFEPERISLGAKIERAAFVACISHFCRSQCMIFSETAHWDRLRIVHCGVRPAYYAPGAAEADADPSAAPLLPPAPAGGRALFVGRMSRLKGGAVLMEAMAAVHAVHPEAELVMVGDGEIRAELEAAVEAGGFAHKVRFLGFRSQPEVRAVMAASDFLVLPSFAEGVPVVLMEAMASGIPVIAPRVAGVSELVEDGVSGFVVPTGDAATLAGRMSALLSDSALRARMGDAGRAMVAAEFDLDGETAWLSQLLQGAAAGALPEGLRPNAPSPLAQAQVAHGAAA